jgi:hypothetical protein
VRHRHLLDLEDDIAELFDNLGEAAGFRGIGDADPRTRTARPLRPVLTMSPTATPPPRSAALTRPVDAIVTWPEDSETDHPGVPAKAAPLASRLMIASP